MSLFIAMPTIEDSETELSVKNAYATSADPDNLYIGMTCTSKLEYYNTLKNSLKEYKNVKIIFLDLKDENVGVGIGRAGSMSMYADQDYALQLDSHTLFEKDWDKTIISLYLESIKETKNKDKTVMTCYLPEYKNSPLQGRIAISNFPKYSFFVSEYVQNYNGSIVPAHSAHQVIKIPVNLRPSKKFIPSIKFNAHFSIGTKKFAEHVARHKDYVFWDEEPIATARMLSEGFSLVFPNTTIPLCHMYGNQVFENPEAVAKRLCIEQLTNQERLNGLCNQSYSKFIHNKNNKSIVKKFSKYTNMDPVTPNIKDWKIPKKYNK